MADPKDYIAGTPKDYIICQLTRAIHVQVDVDAEPEAPRTTVAPKRGRPASSWTDAQRKEASEKSKKAAKKFKAAQTFTFEQKDHALNAALAGLEFESVEFRLTERKDSAVNAHALFVALTDDGEYITATLELSWRYTSTAAQKQTFSASALTATQGMRTDFFVGVAVLAGNVTGFYLRSRATHGRKFSVCSAKTSSLLSAEDLVHQIVAAATSTAASAAVVQQQFVEAQQQAPQKAPPSRRSAVAAAVAPCERQAAPILRPPTATECGYHDGEAWYQGSRFADVSRLLGHNSAGQVSTPALCVLS
jgi:hypothetical protein